MSLMVQVELKKLAHDMGVEVSEVQVLDELTPDELAELRGMVSQALFAPHEHRFGRFGAMARLVPSGVAAKMAEVALGPVMTARVAAVVEPQLAVKMASTISPGFMARMSPHLDPSKIEGILAGLPPETVVDVGRRMVEAREHIALGRFISFVSVATSVQVVADAAPLELLQIALFTEDPASLDAVIAELPDERIVGVLVAAEEAGVMDDAVAMQTPLSTDTRTRILSLASGTDEKVRDELIRSVSRNDTWDQVVSVLDDLGAERAGSLLGVPALQEAEVRAGMTASAAGHPAAERLLASL
jgi:hypothetical protein